MLTLAAGLSTLFFILSGCVAGGRIALLARRTRELPEAMLGPGLLLVVGIGYPILMAGRVVSEQGRDAGPLVMCVALLSMSLGWSMVWTFTWRVFRPEAGWARALALTAYAGFAVCLAESLHSSLTFVHPQDVLIPTWGALGHQANTMVLFVWTGIESFRYWGLLRRRLALGLASPVVANRFFLWGVVAVFSLLTMIGPFIAGLRGVDFMGQPWVLTCVGLGGSATSVALYLAFLPPKAYLRRIEAERP